MGSAAGSAGTAAGKERLLTLGEVADRLSVTPRMIRRLVAERRISFVKVGRHVRFDVHDIDRLVAEGRVEASR